MTAKARESPRPRRVRTPLPRPRVGGDAAHGQPPGGEWATTRPGGASRQRCGSRSMRRSEPPNPGGSALNAEHPRRTRMDGSSCCAAPRAAHRRVADHVVSHRSGVSRRISTGTASTASRASTGSPPAQDHAGAPAAGAHSTSPRTASDLGSTPPEGAVSWTAALSGSGTTARKRRRVRLPMGKRHHRCSQRDAPHLVSSTTVMTRALGLPMEYLLATWLSGRGRLSVTSSGTRPWTP